MMLAKADIKLCGAKADIVFCEATADIMLVQNVQQASLNYLLWFLHSQQLHTIQRKI